MMMMIIIIIIIIIRGYEREGREVTALKYKGIVL